MEGDPTPRKMAPPLMVAARRICLVTSSHLAMNPRLVKEANALASAGYQVHVIASRFFPPMDDLDGEIRRGATWTFEAVDCRNSARAKLLKVLRRGLRLFGRLFPLPGFSLAAITHNASVPILAIATSKHSTDLYIAHCLGGLAAVRIASGRNGTPFSFDAEDYHAAETPFSVEDPIEASAIDRLLRDALPRSCHITASSPLIADAFAGNYGISRPTPILNVFPLSEAPSEPDPGQANNSPKIYWFSQTIGFDRGLEQMLRVLAAMEITCELHLRGRESAGFSGKFLAEGRHIGFRGRIVLHPLAPAAEMARLSAPYDLGLSLEQPTVMNHDLCLGNKIFTYLLAGIPVALTPTSAQSAIASTLGEAALMLDLDHPQDSARILDEFFADSARVTRARQAAWNLGQRQFNWDLEQKKLLTLVAGTIPKS